MNKREYLEEVRSMNQQIDSKLQVLSSLRETAMRLSPGLQTERVSTTRNVTRLEDTMNSVIDLENEIDMDIDRLVRRKLVVTHGISHLESATHRLVLEQRYLCGRDWNEIAGMLNCTRRHVTRLCEAAICALDLDSDEITYSDGNS